MKILFLMPYPHDTAASQRFRFEQYWDLMDEKGYSVEYQSFLDQATWEILYQTGHFFGKTIGVLKGFFRRTVMLFSLKKYDFVFVHREMSPLFPPIFEFAVAKIFKKKIIFDFDDAIWLPNTSASNSLASFLKFPQKTAWICSWAYRISAGNAYLAEYARQFNPNVTINPTTLETQHWHNEIKDQNSEMVRIGWTGTHSTLPYLDFLVPILQKLEKKYAFEMTIICNQVPDFQLDSLRFVAWDKETEIADLLKINIGIMPLTDDIWAKGKCGFKALQYMSLGIPALASPVGVNSEIIDHAENGFLCENESDWEKYLILLLENATLRSEMGKKARWKVENHYSVQSNQANFLSLFE